MFEFAMAPRTAWIQPDCRRVSNHHHVNQYLSILQVEKGAANPTRCRQTLSSFSPTSLLIMILRMHILPSPYEYIRSFFFRFFSFLVNTKHDYSIANPIRELLSLFYLSFILRDGVTFFAVLNIPFLHFFVWCRRVLGVLDILHFHLLCEHDDDGDDDDDDVQAPANQDVRLKSGIFRFFFFIFTLLICQQKHI